MKAKILLHGLILMISISVLSLNAQGVGDQAPDFSATTLDGEEFALSEHIGKMVVIYFFGNGCPYCKSSAPNLESEIYQNYKNAPFTMIGIDTWDASSTESSVSSFKAQTGVTFDLVVNGGYIATTFSSSYDRVIVIDEDGIIRFKGTKRVEEDFENITAAVAEYVPSGVTSIDDVNNPENNNYFISNRDFNNGLIKLIKRKAGQVQFYVYDVTGKKMPVEYIGSLNAGEHEIPVDLSGLNSGIYIYTINSSEIYTSGKFIIK